MSRSNTKPLMSFMEVCGALQEKESYVRSLVKTGALTQFKPNLRVRARYYRVEVEAILDGRATQAAITAHNHEG